MFFLPKKSKIMERLIEQSSLVKDAAQAFQEITNDWGKLQKNWTTLQGLENQADEFVHAITDEIEKVFILPLDKEDIKVLTETIDDLLDNLEQVTSRLNIYRIKETNQVLKDFASLILKSVQLVHRCILIVNEQKFSSDEFATYCKKLHEIETEGDRLHREVLEKMMGQRVDFGGTDFLTVMKWKEIFQTLEDTLDKCEELAAIFGRMRIKYR